MAIAEAIISALAAVFAVKGIDKLESKNNADGSTSIIIDDKKIGNISPEIGVVSPLEQLFTVNTTNTKLQNHPDLEIPNDLDANQRIYGFSIVPDVGFKTKGHVIILINERLFFEGLVGDLNLSALNFNIPSKGLEFQRGSKIEVFVWNEIDATQISIKVEVFTGI